MTKQTDNTFTIRERIIIALLHFLINFIGKKVDGYYGYQLDTCLHEIFYPNLENKMSKDIPEVGDVCKDTFF